MLTLLFAFSFGLANPAHASTKDECVKFDFFGHTLTGIPDEDMHRKGFILCEPLEYDSPEQKLKIKANVGSAIMLANNYWAVGYSELQVGWQIRPSLDSVFSRQDRHGKWVNAVLEPADSSLDVDCYYTTCFPFREDGTFMGVGKMLHTIDSPRMKFTHKKYGINLPCQITFRTTDNKPERKGYWAIYLDRSGEVISCF